MDTLLLYILKVNGLLILFYLLYKISFEKTTFYRANRFYFIGALVFSLLVPLCFFTKTIIISSTVTHQNSVQYLTTNTSELSSISTTACLITISLLPTIYLFIRFLYLIIKTNTLYKNASIISIKNIKYFDQEQIKTPFSFWNSIYYNSKNYSKAELKVILLHEEVHINQKHSIDLLFIQMICCFFWFNPWVWKIKKSLIQNLEFLTDEVVLEQTTEKILYQKTLLKTMGIDLTNELTHPFNQSFLKTRIMKIHQNKTKKVVYWRYSLSLVVLTGFMLLFQVKTVAQDQQNSIQKTNNTIKTSIGNPPAPPAAPIALIPDTLPTAPAAPNNSLTKAISLLTNTESEDEKPLYIYKNSYTITYTHSPKETNGDTEWVLIDPNSEEGKKLIEKHKTALQQSEVALKHSKIALENSKLALADRKQVELDRKQAEVDRKRADVDRKQAELDRKRAEVNGKQALKDSKQALKDQKQALKERKNTMKFNEIMEYTELAINESIRVLDNLGLTEE